MPQEARHGTEIAWQVIGHGPRPALAVHCMLGNSEMWTPVLAPLGETLSATAFDMPGHGKSAPWAEDTAPGAYQTLVTRIAASFIDRPLDLIGHSFGASVALRIAVAAPEAVRSLTLIEPVLFAAITDTPEGADWQHKQARLDADFAAARYEDAARDFMTDWGAGTEWDDLPQRLRERFTRQMPMVASASQSNFADPGRIWRADGIEGIDAPVMLVHGTESPPAVRVICEAIAARLGDVGIASVPGAGHMAPLTHPEAVRGLIAANLERS